MGWKISLTNHVGNLTGELGTINWFGYTIDDHESGFGVGGTDGIFIQFLFQVSNLNGIMPDSVSKATCFDEFYGALIIFKYWCGRR